MILNRTGTTKDNSLLASRAGGGGTGCARLSMASVEVSPLILTVAKLCWSFWLAPVLDS
jgi:hypothetical protein